MVFVCLIYNYFAEKKAKKNEINRKEIENANNISTGFLLTAKADILKKFCQKLEKKYPTKQEKGYIKVNSNILIPMFETQEITDKEVFNAYLKTKSLECKKLILVCNSFSNSATTAKELIKDKNIVILDAMNAYKNIYKPLQFDIPKFENKPEKKHKVKNMLNVAFSKKQTKSYFFVSAFLLFGSFVLRYNVYYLIMASITTLFALYAHFNKRFNFSRNPNGID